MPNPFRTSGVENIEKRYSSGGGSKNHLPATATKRGDHDAVVGNTEKAKGIGSPQYEDTIQGQKPEVSVQRGFLSVGISWEKQRFFVVACHFGCCDL